MLEVNLKHISLSRNDHSEAILQHIHFALEPGHVYTILGQNGAGKSVLIKSLTSLLNENDFLVEGSVKFQNIDLLSCKTAQLNKIRRDKIKYIFQDAVNSFDPLKRLNYYFNSINQFDQQSVEQIFDELLLPTSAEVFNRFPHELSYGQLQRICFALALLSKPNILILDEPTSTIDVVNSAISRKILNEFIGSDNSVLIVTHDLKFAMKTSNYLAFLNDRKLSEFYTPSQIEDGSIPAGFKHFIDAYTRVIA